MNIVLFSDIHGNLEALEAIVNDIEFSEYDKVIFLGDVIGIGPSSKECLELINKYDIDCILGNHEIYYLDPKTINIKREDVIKHLEYIANSLDDKCRDIISKWKSHIDLNIDGNKIEFTHFLYKDKNIFYDPKDINNEEVLNDIFKEDRDIYFVGHKHTPFIIKRDNKQIIDFGSSGCTDSDMTFYVILKIHNNVIEMNKKYIRFNRNKLVEKINNSDYPAKEFFSKKYFNVN